ncbi:MAG TPA: hypothetical protein VNZ06_14160 [Steroidobacteraceae bacterium]|jgi:hypothetical protein|nr:hypothetical protein [Steroidobacteraceae bacterium]
MSEPTDRNANDTVQGEGDYDAARRYRDKVADFIKRSDVEDLARKSAPLSAREARDDALADERARGRSKGDIPADIGVMYPHQGSSAHAETSTDPQRKK